MSDIVERLREEANEIGAGYIVAQLRAAADEIERLRVLVELLTAEIAKSCDDTRFEDWDHGCLRAVEAEKQRDALAAQVEQQDGEIEALKHDIERHIAIASELSGQVETVATEIREECASRIERAADAWVAEGIDRLACVRLMNIAVQLRIPKLTSTERLEGK